MHHHLVAALPLTDMHLPFNAKEVGGKRTSQDDNQGSMNHHQRPSLFPDVVIPVEQQEEVDHDQQLEKEEQGRIIDQHSCCHRTHLLLHHDGYCQSCCINQHQDNGNFVGG